MITKTRKQGNSIMLTVPKDFNVPNIAEDTLTNSKVMTKEELATEIGL